MRRLSSATAPVLVAAMLSLGHPASAQQPSGQPLPVGTVVAAKQPVNRGIDFVGRVEAIDRVEIRARVTGFLQAAFFKEGDTVKEGDKLFQIDPAPFEAALQQAQGALLQAQATLTNAGLQRARAEELVKTSATSVAVRDERLAAERNAQGAVAIADADLKTATINLGYTTIIAPITGKIGRAKVTKGNVVSPDSGPLVLIVSQDPMYVTFPVSQREFLRIRQEGGKTSRDSLVVKLRFADGSAYDQDGKIDFVDVTVSRGTDTVSVRARVPNPTGALTDGQFMRVVVQGDTPEEKIVVPQAALLADQEGVYVFAVQDGKAVVKRVKTGPEVGTGIAIEQGLSGGEQVVVSGLQSLRPGAIVVASPMPAATTPTATPAKGG
jgi:membrane fusion protein (multidrug efflux system)